MKQIIARRLPLVKCRTENRKLFTIHRRSGSEYDMDCGLYQTIGMVCLALCRHFHSGT
jgi:hypothetical protein